MAFASAGILSTVPIYSLHTSELAEPGNDINKMVVAVRRIDRK